MTDRIRQAGQFVLDGLRDSTQQAFRDHGRASQQDGFTIAAGITLRRVQAKLDALKEQMRGQGLTKAEQAIYTQLDELKSEIEAEYDRFWQGTGVDWRPRKPVAIAKRVARETGEPHS